jgi:hypothetical protein
VDLPELFDVLGLQLLEGCIQMLLHSTEPVTERVKGIARLGEVDHNAHRAYFAEILERESGLEHIGKDSASSEFVSMDVGSASVLGLGGILEVQSHSLLEIITGRLDIEQSQDEVGLATLFVAHEDEYLGELLAVY